MDCQLFVPEAWQIDLRRPIIQLPMRPWPGPVSGLLRMYDLCNRPGFEDGIAKTATSVHTYGRGVSSNANDYAIVYDIVARMGALAVDNYGFLFDNIWYNTLTSFFFYFHRKDSTNNILCKSDGIYEQVAGVSTKKIAFTPANGDRIQISVENNIVKCWRNGQLVGQFTTSLVPTTSNLIVYSCDNNLAHYCRGMIVQKY